MAMQNAETSPQWIISLDFELLWGVRDHATQESYGANVLGARTAIPRILDLFESSGIQATWATVGFLFCESREHLLHSLPQDEERPSYANPGFSNYNFLNEVGDDEQSSPHYLAPSLIRQVAQTPGQEIATHTLSHYYCLEAGQTVDQFKADIRAARSLAATQDIDLKSIVFPRNQYAAAHLAACQELGITSYRGNPDVWAYRPSEGSGQTQLRRGLRLMDAHTGLLGHQTFQPQARQPRNIPASQFLRPKAGRLGRLHPLHIRTIKAGMSQAARTGRSYHLWWHPHNFGVNTDDNLTALGALADHFKVLQDRHGMVSRSMQNAA